LRDLGNAKYLDLPRYWMEGRVKESLAVRYADWGVLRTVPNLLM